jgi:hypothetical protein
VRCGCCWLRTRRPGDGFRPMAPLQAGTVSATLEGLLNDLCQLSLGQEGVTWLEPQGVKPNVTPPGLVVCEGPTTRNVSALDAVNKTVVWVCFVTVTGTLDLDMLGSDDPPMKWFLPHHLPPVGAPDDGHWVGDYKVSPHTAWYAHQASALASWWRRPER